MAGVRHLLEAVKQGWATETLLAELAVEEERAKEIARQLAELELSPREGPKPDTYSSARSTAAASPVSRSASRAAEAIASARPGLCRSVVYQRWWPQRDVTG